MGKLIIGIGILILLGICYFLGDKAIQSGNEKGSKRAQFALAVLTIVVDLFALVIPGVDETLMIGKNIVDVDGSGNNGNITDISGEGNNTVVVNPNGDGTGTTAIISGGNTEIVNNYYISSGFNESEADSGAHVFPAPSLDFEYDVLDRFLVGWGDNSGGRESYSYEEYQSGVLDGQIVFNSIRDSVIGHEFNFVGARVNDGKNEGAKNIWNGNVIEAEADKTYLVRLYVHNNGAAEDIAQDVSVRFMIGNMVAVTENDVMLNGFNSGDGYYCVAVYGFIHAANATPSEYFDGVKFVSNRPFHLEFIPGTARYENNEIGRNPGYILSDDVVTSGVLIGYAEMDGQIPGGYPFDSFTGITVRPVFDD